MVKITKKDIELICFLLTLEKEVTTSDVAKMFFSTTDTYELIKKDSFVRQWFQRFERAGIVKKLSNGGKATYTLDPNRVRVGKQLFVDWSSHEVYEADVVGLYFEDTGWLYFEMPPEFSLKVNGH